MYFQKISYARSDLIFTTFVLAFSWILKLASKWKYKSSPSHSPGALLNAAFLDNSGSPSDQ